jgi:hypothetical protein
MRLLNLTENQLSDALKLKSKSNPLSLLIKHNNFQNFIKITNISMPYKINKM